MQVAARDTPGHTWAVSAELMGGQAGFATELLAEDDPQSQGKQELQPPALRKCSSSHGSVGKAHSHLLLQHRPFPCSFLPVHECKYNTV